MPQWDAQAYLQFANERTQPALDLAARVSLVRPKRIVDLGCGPGNSTAILRRRWPQAEVIGMDNSATMIAAATQAYPEGEWLQADIAAWTASSPADLIFSNAALQWVPNHARLLPQLWRQVAAGGALAVQIPAHHYSPVREMILEVANDPAWSHLMTDPGRAMTIEPPAFYYRLLQPLAAHLEMWETAYYHFLDGPRAIVDWFRSTGLRPFLAVLESQEQKLSFEAKLLERFTRNYPRQPDGKVLFPFRRLFFIAYRAEPNERRSSHAAGGATTS